MAYTVEEWNRYYPAGTHVYLRGNKERTYMTRSKAAEHSSGIPQIWLTGIWGSYNLAAVEPVTPVKGRRRRS